MTFNKVFGILTIRSARGCAGARYTIDPDILGGIVIYIGDKIFDGSVRSRLENIKQSL